MKAKVIESADFRKYGDEVSDVLEEPSVVLSREERKDLEIEEQRVENHRKIEAATGVKLAVATEADPHVAAFVTTADSKAHIVLHTLDHYEWALYAARHEGEHLHNQFYVVDLEEHLETEQIDTLEGALELPVPDLKDVNLVEGFNDLITARKHGANDNSGYKDEEVPVAEQLEALCNRELGESLVSAFDQGDEDLFYDRLSRLADILRIKKFLKAA